MADLINLYSKRILALAADIPHGTRLADPDATSTKRSPLCGSTVTIDIKMDQGRIIEYGQDVKACALGQAAASVLGEHVIGLSLEQAYDVREALRGMLKDGAEPPTGTFYKLALLEPARDYKNRHASVMLAYDAVIEAMESVHAQVCADG